MEYNGEKYKNGRFCVFVPNEIIDNHYCGKIYGFYHPESDAFNVTGTTYNENTTELGSIKDTNAGDESNSLTGYWENDRLCFFYNERLYEVVKYELQKNIFSRNQGILETTWMQNKKAIIIGVGSVGSLISLELAKSGISQFILIDKDIVNYDNLCRHQCGISDVGMYKVDAIKRRILDINPSAQVVSIKMTLENVDKDYFDGVMDSNTIIIGCADNRFCDALGNQLAVLHSTPFVSVGFWERACVGEIFYYLPCENLPCYKSAFANVFKSESVRNRKFYTMKTDLKNVYYSPGIAADIDYVTIIAVKLILDILNKGNKDYIAKVLPSLTSYTLVCNCNNPTVGGDVLEIFSYPLQITRNLKVCFNDSICADCSLVNRCRNNN